MAWWSKDYEATKEGLSENEIQDFYYNSREYIEKSHGVVRRQMQDLQKGYNKRAIGIQFTGIQKAIVQNLSELRKLWRKTTRVVIKQFIERG